MKPDVLSLQNMIELNLIKEMGYERIHCACGVAVLPKDPTPGITRMVRDIAIQEGVKFSIIDTSVYPEVIKSHGISELPAVLIGNNIYEVDEYVIREALRIKRTMG